MTRAGRWAIAAAIIALAGEALRGLDVVTGPRTSGMLAAAAVGAVIAAPFVRRLGALAVVPLFVAAARALESLATTLHPFVHDAAVAAVDAGLGLGPRTLPGGALGAALAAVPYALPVGVALAQIAEARRPGRARGDAGVSFGAAVLAWGALAHALPLLGPRAYLSLPAPSTPAPLPLFGALAPPLPRGAFPSLPLLVALLLFWHARGLGRGAALGAAALLALTAGAALGGSDSYAVALAATIPLALALRAALASARWGRARATSLAFGLVAVGAWVVLLRAAPLALARRGWLAWSLIAATALTAFALERRLAAEETPLPDERAASPEGRLTALLAAVLAMFFASGFAGLVYEVMFAKSLALVFGSTQTASTTVLATYMGGMSLGSWLGGKLAARARFPLRAYAACEAGVAVACAVSPLLFAPLQRAYATLAHGLDPGHPALVALQVALGAALLLPPTVLMGVTLPLVARVFAVERAGLGRTVGALYAANTLGAAAGALATGYALLPWLGVTRTTLLAVAIDAAVVVLALGLRLPGATPSPETSDALFAEPRTPADPRPLGLLVLAAGGVVTLALEGVYTHLLAVVAGNSAFAFSAMLTCFLVGLGLGSSFGRAWLRRGGSLLVGLGAAEALAALAVLGGALAWNVVPGYFASFDGYPLARSFGARECVRFAVCALTLLPPAVFIGAAYPLAMEHAGRSGGDRVQALGRAAALNTLGNIAGALLGGFVLLPRLESLRSLQLLAGLSLALALVVLAAASPRERAALAAPIALAALALVAQPARLDLDRLASGANVYFRAPGWGRVIDHAESADGGLTTVNLSGEDEGEPMKTLLTNGKFQGNDSRSGELTAQVSFALLPLLHTPARDRALVIGFGTGTSARVVRDAGFASVDVAELSRDIATLSDRHFASVNDHVLASPNVHLHVTDGRNYLLVGDGAYDLVSMEISSIWFAGASSLYDVELYELARARLSPRGVLQQWVQIHHLAPEDYVTILSSVRSVFSRVWLYESGGQGILVACDHDCDPTPSAVARIDGEPRLAESLRLFPGGARDLSRACVLTPSGVDRFLADAGATLERLAAFASTDDNLRLEYSTPRGNVREYDESYRANMNRFAPFRVVALSGP